MTEEYRAAQLQVQWVWSMGCPFNAVERVEVSSSWERIGRSSLCVFKVIPCSFEKICRS